MSFSDAFAKARAEQGQGGSFTYNGTEYSTNYAEEGYSDSGSSGNTSIATSTDKTSSTTSTDKTSSTTSTDKTSGSSDDTKSNSWTEWFANTFTPGDGAAYVNGVLTYDGTLEGTTEGQVVPKNEDGGYGGVDEDGNAIFSGSANSVTNDDGYLEGTYEKYTATDAVGAIINPLSGLTDGLAWLFRWANGIDPAADDASKTSGTVAKMSGGTKEIAIYTNSSYDPNSSTSVQYYSYNAAGLPYEVVQNQDAAGNVIAGSYVDKLAVKVDENGNLDWTAQNTDGSTALSGYGYNKANASDDTSSEDISNQEKLNTGDDASSDESSSADDGTSTDLTAVEALQEWSKAAGLDLQQTDLEAMVADPAAWAESRNLKLEDLVPTLNADAEGTTLDPNDPNYNIGAVDGANIDVTTVADNSVSTISGVTSSDPATYTASLNSDKLDDSFNVNAVTGEINENNLVDASTIETDIEAAASGTSAVGKAINDYATQDFSTIIDTSTVSGKNLAKALGEGNYVDQKATITGQMEIISAQFVNEQGQSVIPKWAQKIARSVSQTIAFDGITGSASTSAMATAIMEATLGVAEKEATFFQTLTTKNLDNRQQSIINKANVLAKFEVANLGARQAAAVQNAQAFLEMDLKNLTNEQQAEVINKQAKTQALFEDSKIINAQRLFTAETENEYKKFYDELNVAIQKHNSTELNSMKKFNAEEINDNSEFNATIEDSRQRFYANLQYNIDTSNAKWRQEVTVKQFQAEVDAVAADVKNALDLSTEAMSQLWDRADSLLDFIFKKDNGDADRLVTLLGSQLTAEAQTSGGTNWLDAVLGIGGAVAGTTAGTDAIISGVKNLWNWATSDIRLKKNIKLLENRNGINIYKWDWTDKALSMGVDKSYTAGVIAQDLQKTHPEAISKDASGYLMVNYEVVQNAIQ